MFAFLNSKRGRHDESVAIFKDLTTSVGARSINKSPLYSESLDNGSRSLKYIPGLSSSPLSKS